MLNVGVAGLGAMGEPMARHLHAAGMLHAVHNRTPAKADALAGELGVEALHDATALAQACDAIVTCVTADADVLRLADAFARAGKPGLLVIDTSTTASASARRAAEVLRAAGGEFIDAPVSGGAEGARNGRLSVMAGADVAALERALPVLRCFAARVTHMGPVGAGQDTKAVNQVLVAGIAQAVCEGLALGEALGLDAEKLIGVLGAGAAGNWFLDKRGATMLRNEFKPGFKLGLLHKDLMIVRQLAEAAGVDRTIVEASLADYAELMRRGLADEDTSALIRLKRPAR